MSLRRQSAAAVQKASGSVVMEPLKQSASPESEHSNEKLPGDGGEEDPKADDGTAHMSRNDGVSDGMESDPAPIMSDTDAESERDSNLPSDISAPSESTEVTITSVKTANVGVEGEEGECVRGGGGEGEGGRGDTDRQISTETHSHTLFRLDNDDLSASHSERVAMEMTSSTDDLMAIISGEPPSEEKPHPPVMPQCSTMSLDALLGDTAYFLHFRVISNSGQRYTRDY